MFYFSQTISLFLAHQRRKSEVFAWDINSFLAHQIRKSDVFAWDRNSYLTHNSCANRAHDSWERKGFSVILFHINICFKLNFLKKTSSKHSLGIYEVTTLVYNV